MPAPPKPERRQKKLRRPIARSKTPIKRSSRPARVRRTAGGKARLAADLAWAQAVRAKGPCIARGKVMIAEITWHIGGVSGSAVEITHQECRGGLTAAHVIRRGYLATRTDLANGVPLCLEAHDFMTRHPDRWVDFISEYLGAAEYERLRQKALAGPHNDRQDPPMEGTKQ